MVWAPCLGIWILDPCIVPVCCASRRLFFGILAGGSRALKLDNLLAPLTPSLRSKSLKRLSLHLKRNQHTVNPTSSASSRTPRSRRRL
ncbi:hypothetical protein DFH29DRAFT_913754 [Suillus ampliporus]|nr:hypothetical protein DFH29DRAFT_913754 [Suillus ampliporus]